MLIASLVALFAAADAAPLVTQPVATASQGVTAYPADYFAASSPTNAFDMISRLPGFSFDGGSGVRGFGGAAGNVLIDGERPSSKTDGLQNVLQRIPVSQVERIDVIRGGAPGIDMQGKSVIANIVRKKGATTTGVFQIDERFIYDGRRGPGLRLEATHSNGPRRFEGAVIANSYYDDGSGDGARVTLSPTGAVIRNQTERTEGDGEQASLSGAMETPLWNGKARVNATLFGDRYYYDEVDQDVGSPATSAAYDRERQDRWNSEVGARWNRALRPGLRLETILLQQNSGNTYTGRYHEPGFAAVFQSDRTGGESIARAALKYRRSDRLSFEGGGEVAYNWLDSKTAYSQNGAPVVLPAANVQVTEKRGEAFAVMTWKPRQRLSVEVGARLEGSHIASDGDVTLEKSLVFAKPRVSLSWDARPGTQVRLRVEREVGQLDFGDFVASSNLSVGTVSAGNPDLEPEQAWVSEAVVEQRFWGDGALVLTARHRAITDVVDRAPVFSSSGVFDAPANIGDGRRDDFIVDLTLPMDRFGLKTGQFKAYAGFRHSEVTDPTTHRKRPISGLKPIDWSLVYTQEIRLFGKQTKFGTEVYGSWVQTSYLFDTVDTVKLRTFVVPYFDIRLKPDLILRLNFQNITSRDLEHIREVYAGPRGTAPLRYRETQLLDNGPAFQIRLRKTFG